MSVKKNEQTGKWDVRVWYRDITGERKQTTKRGFQTKKSALEWENQFILQRSGQLDMNFGKFVDLYLNEVGVHVRKSTMDTKTAIINSKIRPYFEKRKIQDITPADIKKWQAVMCTTTGPNNKPYSQDYLRTVNNVLSAIFNYAVNIYGLRVNPVRRAGGMGKEVKKTEDYWTKEEFLKFIDTVADHTEYYYAFELLYWTGIRKGELLALTPADFDLENRTLRINKQYRVENGRCVIAEPKTPKSNRTIILPKFLVEEVKQYLELLYKPEQETRIFTFHRGNLNKMLIKGAKKANLKQIDVHGLRHSHVSLLVNAGFTVLAIGDRLGHEAQEITYRYAHLFKTEQARMAKALDKEMEEMTNA